MKAAALLETESGELKPQRANDRDGYLPLWGRLS